MATSCWLGGLWSDAIGEHPDAREPAIRRRCETVLDAIGASPVGAYAPLRAVDPRTVQTIASRIHTVALHDEFDTPNADALVDFFYAVADASRENVRARHAADKVKQIFESFPNAEDRRKNKIAAAPELHHGFALHALLNRAGLYAAEARVIGTMMVLDRMEIAHGLPKHLKIETLAGPFSDLFGVAPPKLPADPSSPIRTGTWLAYLTSVAAAARHPVPPDARDPQNREPLAWNGVLAGIADKLRSARSDPGLDAVAKGMVDRLDDQHRGEVAVFQSLPDSKK
jgi:hypothetical protein